MSSSYSAVPSCGEDNFRVSFDRFCDFIPIVSTATNLIDLFQRRAYSAPENAETSFQDSYWSYISNKDDLRCILLAIPVFNIPVAIYYYFFSSEEVSVVKDDSESFDDEVFSVKDISLNSKANALSLTNVPSEESERLFEMVPSEVLCLILSFAHQANPHSLSNAFKVSHLWSNVVKVAVEEVFRAEAFGNTRWAEVGGGDVVKDENMDEEAASLTEFIDDITKDTFKALYMLRIGRIVRMPEKLDLENTGLLVELQLSTETKKGYEIFNPPNKIEHARGSYWFWGSIHPIRLTAGQEPSIQQKLLAENGFQESHAREIAAGSFAEFTCSGKIMERGLWACCLDEKDIVQTLVRFNEDGLSVMSVPSDFSRGNWAVFGMLRWQPMEVKPSVIG